MKSKARRAQQLWSQTSYCNNITIDNNSNRNPCAKELKQECHPLVVDINIAAQMSILAVGGI